MDRSEPRRQITRTAAFRAWTSQLDPRSRVKVEATLEHVAAGGPTLGRPRVDTLHGSRLPKLKEARVDRRHRVLIAFDSHRNLVALDGGDKAAGGARWYDTKIRQAERRYLDHERQLGKGGPSPPSRTIGRQERGMSR